MIPPYKDTMLGKINLEGYISINKDKEYRFMVCPEMSSSEGIMLCKVSCAKFKYTRRIWRGRDTDYYIQLCGNPNILVKILVDERFGYNNE